MRNHWNKAIAIAAMASSLFSGCSRLSTKYGRTKGTSGRTSLNGFGALRKSYTQAGFRTRDVTRLSDRVMRTHVIVWTPQMLGAVDVKVTRWFERWLRRGSRTLVYVVPDSGSEADYWADAAMLAPPEQRLEYRKRAARSINERMMWRLNRGQVQSNGWFRLEPLVQRTTAGQISGPWTEVVVPGSPDEADVSIEYRVVAFKSDKNQAGTKAMTGIVNTGPTGPGTPTWSFPAETQPSKTETSFSERVTTEAGIPMVAEIRSRRWKDSKIIVVAGGSLLTNFAYSRSLNRRLADKIIAESIPTVDQEFGAGFLTSSWQQIPVSEKKPGVPEPSGMELLTVWPLSLVTLHGVMLGLVICLMLLPIFGRPKRIRRAKPSDFGDHLDAVAALMNRAGGEQYARARISEYMKRMHAETSGPWVLPDRPGQDAHATLPILTPKRLTSMHTPGGADPDTDRTGASPAAHESVARHEAKESENDEAEL